MSSWRRKAIEFFPEKHFDNGQDYFSVYAVFFKLLPWVRQAHKDQSEDILHKIYEYAEWCWRQKGKSSETYNAVCVAFYEHLVDEDITCREIPFWIKPEIFEDIRELLKSRMSIDNYQTLLSEFNSVNQTKFN